MLRMIFILNATVPDGSKKSSTIPNAVLLLIKAKAFYFSASNFHPADIRGPASIFSLYISFRFSYFWELGNFIFLLIFSEIPLI